jgi:replication factor C small subunit
LKVVILDEADFLSASSQASLRNLMETYSSTTRFILTCNYVEKIIDPLCSRSQVFKLEPPSLKDVAVHIKNILDKESIKYELVDLKKIVQDFYPDVRKIINFIQQSSSDGKLKILQSQGASFDLKNKLIDLLKSAKTNGKSFNEIRQLINDAGTRNFEELYTELYSRIDEYAVGKETLIIIEIAEYVYQSSMVVDKEITFMACIAKVIKTINK